MEQIFHEAIETKKSIDLAIGYNSVNNSVEVCAVVKIIRNIVMHNVTMDNFTKDVVDVDSDILNVRLFEDKYFVHKKNSKGEYYAYNDEEYDKLLLHEHSNAEDICCFDSAAGFIVVGKQSILKHNDVKMEDMKLLTKFFKKNTKDLELIQKQKLDLEEEYSTLIEDVKQFLERQQTLRRAMKDWEQKQALYTKSLQSYSTFHKQKFSISKTPYESSNFTQQAVFCTICLIKQSTHVLVPCGHLCLCTECKDMLQKNTCPFCSKKIESIIKVYGLLENSATI